MAKKILKYVGRFFLVVLTTVVILVGGVIGLVFTFNYGPSPAARSLFVTSVLETSAAGFLATWFFPSEEIELILENNTVEEFDVVTNPNLIMIPKEEDQGEGITVTESEQPEFELIPVSGLTYKGRALLIKDPSRVKVGTCKDFANPGKQGQRLEVMVKRYDAIAAINGGGFEDGGGMGSGSVPIGFVFSQGEYKFGPLEEEDLIIGFDKNDCLIVGNMTGNKAKELGIRDALSFGPALIINGEPANISGMSSGLNPRTAIGQRADGTVIFVVIDGRQPSSLGASYADLVDIMANLGAVNAANLDGGSSSLMIYNGETISESGRFTAERYLPDCFYVERREGDE